MTKRFITKLLTQIWIFIHHHIKVKPDLGTIPDWTKEIHKLSTKLHFSQMKLRDG